MLLNQCMMLFSFDCSFDTPLPSTSLDNFMNFSLVLQKSCCFASNCLVCVHDVYMHIITPTYTDRCKARCSTKFRSTYFFIRYMYTYLYTRTYTPAHLQLADSLVLLEGLLIGDRVELDDSCLGRSAAHVVEQDVLLLFEWERSDVVVDTELESDGCVIVHDCKHVEARDDGGVQHGLICMYTCFVTCMHIIIYVIVRLCERVEACDDGEKQSGLGLICVPLTCEDVNLLAGF
jgi:hypothetical protein